MRFRSAAQRKAVFANLHRFRHIHLLPSPLQKRLIYKPVTRYTKPSEKTGYSFLDYDLSQAKKIGSGRDRTVYELPDGKLIKIAKNPNGLLQNDSAGDYLVKDITPKLYEKGNDYIIVENVEYNTKKIRPMINELQKFNSTEFMEKNSELQELFNRLDEKYNTTSYSCLMNYNLAWQDFIRIKNWGWKDNRPVLLDEGVLNENTVPIISKDKYQSQMRNAVNYEQHNPEVLNDWIGILRNRKVARSKGFTVITNGNNKQIVRNNKTT